MAPPHVAGGCPGSRCLSRYPEEGTRHVSSGQGVLTALLWLTRRAGHDGRGEWQ